MPFFLRYFRSSQSGQVAVLFGLMLVPICAVCGFCLDYQHTTQRAQKVQAVLDSAVLAAARVKQTGAPEDETKAAVGNFLTAQIANLGGLNCQAPTVSLTADSQIQAEVECTQETSLMQLVGADEMPFLVESASHYTVGHLDVAFTFDASDSMDSDNRLTDLKAAATEALDILLPSGAPYEVIENTRVAMSSYSTMLNAGPYFEQVTGVLPSRTYYHTSERALEDDDLAPGDQFNEMHIGLYDADTGSLIAELGDGAVIRVPSSALDDMTVAITLDSAHTLEGDVESVRLTLSGEETANNSENIPPYSLYGDSGIANLDGQRWETGEYSLRVRAYAENDLSGLRVFDEELDFRLFVDGDTETSTISYTLDSTCVLERIGTEGFTDAPPGPGAYLSYQDAWFLRVPTHPRGGIWKFGYVGPGSPRQTSEHCNTQPPVELTNDRTVLLDYVSSLTTDAYTAGHLGVAWSWYLISDRWSSIFDGDAEPVAFTDPDITKAIVLMTDGAFNFYASIPQGHARDQARALCDNIKLKGVSIYAVAFKAPAYGQDVLKYCVSDPGYFYDAQDGEELKKAYKEIALSLSDLRISQ